LLHHGSGGGVGHGGRQEVKSGGEWSRGGKGKIVLELVLLLVLDQEAWQARKAVGQRSGRIEDEFE
jgi:hypothetical protein